MTNHSFSGASSFRTPKSRIFRGISSTLAELISSQTDHIHSIAYCRLLAGSRNKRGTNAQARLYASAGLEIR